MTTSMIQFLDNLDVLISADKNFALFREFVLKAAANGKFGLADKTIRSKFKPEELDPLNWDIVKVEEISEFTNGFAFKSSDYEDSGVGIIRMSDLKNGEISLQQLKYVSKHFLTDLSPAIQVKPNDLVIGMSGSIGRPCFNRTDKTLLLNQRVGKLTPNLSLVTPEYLAISLASLEQHFLQISMGSAIKNLSTAQIKQTKLLLPPLAIQEIIVNHYEQFLSLLTNLNVALLSKESAATRFRNSAIDAISTVESKEDLQISWQRLKGNWEILTGNDQGIQPIRLLIHDLATKGILTSRGIFEEVVLKDIAKINYGYTESATGMQAGPKFLRITDIQMGKVDWDSVPFCPISASDEDKHLLKDGDLVFARTGATTGKSFLLNNPPRAVCASYLIRVRPDSKKVLSEYLYLYFQSGKYWMDVKNGMSGTAQGGFNSSKLGALVIPIPDLATQAEIVNKATELLHVCDILSDSLSRKQILAQKFTQSVFSKSV